MSSGDDKEQPITPAKEVNDNGEAEAISPTKEDQIVSEEELKEAEPNEEATTQKVEGENSKKNKRVRAKRNKKKNAQAKTPVKESDLKTPIKSGGKVESKGMIFMCNSKTKQDCFRYNVLGLPSSKKGIVLSIYKGMRLFLYDVDSRLMHGIYRASAPGGYNIEPQAFNSDYPSQVRFEVMSECAPLDSEKFKVAIKDNYTSKNRFKFELNSKQVKDLCRIFNSGSEKGTGYGSGGRPVERSGPMQPIPREPVYYPQVQDMVVAPRVVPSAYYSHGGPVYVRDDRYVDAGPVYREPYPLNREVGYPVYQEPVYASRYEPAATASYGYRGYDRPY